MKKKMPIRKKNELRTADLSVVAIDCQATHSNPVIGHLAEIGWVKTQAMHPFDHEMVTENVRTHLVKTGKNVSIPKQFLCITGIKPEEMKETKSKKIIWQKLYQTAKKTAAENQLFCPAVIHFRRYEEPYLRQLHQEFSPEDKFPFTIICTHEITQKLFPGLPRKSLRAVAGYFGLSLPDFRRSLHHVVATAFIWNHVVRILEEQEKIIGYAELLDWLAHPPSPIPSKHRARDYPMEKALRDDLPDRPGIYRMYRSTGDLLYIGKAKSLKHRVNSYFHKRGRHAEHILEMLSQAQDLSTSVTETAVEAAVRESDEIKLHSPPYNRALRPNERKLLFYSKDLKSKYSHPHIRHPLGPIPSNVNMDAIVRLLDVLNGKIKIFPPPTIEAILDTPSGFAADKECFLRGLEAFKREYCVQMNTPVNVNNVMKWGARFWLEKLLEKESERDEEEAVEEEEEKEEEVWTPERVFRTLKRVNRVMAFQIRRSRWFCRLCESTIRWTATEKKKERTHLLIIKNGTARFTKNETAPGKTIGPPGHQRILLDRQRCFDILTYDRMRIITSEMRRLIHEGRDIQLCFHPGNNLNAEQLEKMLKWV